MRIDSTNDCVTVSGELTDFENGDDTDAVTTAKAVLENGMSNNEFWSAHDSLVQITYCRMSCLQSPRWKKL